MVRLESLVLQWSLVTSYHDRKAASELNLAAYAVSLLSIHVHSTF